MKKLMMVFAVAVAAAMAMGVMAETTNTVKVTKFHQSYPYSGKAMVEYTISHSGRLPEHTIAEIVISTADASATFVQRKGISQENSQVIDFASSFGGALLLTNATFTVTIKFDGVQLWANGPYWAKCNVGATTPEDSGYYFWWGDTVGYKLHKGTWNGYNSYTDVDWLSSKPREYTDMNPFFAEKCQTYGFGNETLTGPYIDESTGCLTKHKDAATWHLRSPWRMPTHEECNALGDNCDSTWITTNGVNGRLVTGRGAYANRSIFLPATGYAHRSLFQYVHDIGRYWSSTPEGTNRAWCIDFATGLIHARLEERYYGMPVRAVEDFSEYGAATGTVTCDTVPPAISPASGTTFEGSQTVTISCETEGAEIYYTTDGSAPTKDSTPYTRFRIRGKTTVKAVAYNPETGLYSKVTTAEYALGTCANPVIAPEGGTAVATEGGYVFRHSGQTVTIARNGEEGTVRYTLDGTDPTAESAVYSGAITLDATTTIKAKVFSDSYFDSETVTVAFTREWEQVATPEIAAAATFTGTNATCEITCATEGASIFYTLDGSDPTSASTLYEGTLCITGSCTVKAIALLNDYIDSGIAAKTITRVWTIGEAMGAPDQAFTTGGSGGLGWTRVTDAMAPNDEAMKSGAITHSQTSALSTMVTGAGTLTFTWRTSCEKDPDDYYEWDHAELAVDGTVVRRLDGVTAWQTESVPIASVGGHAVEWRYVKDDAGNAGEDAAWVTGFGWVATNAATQVFVGGESAEFGRGADGRTLTATVPAGTRASEVMVKVDGIDVSRGFARSVEGSQFTAVLLAPYEVPKEAGAPNGIWTENGDGTVTLNVTVVPGLYYVATSAASLDALKCPGASAPATGGTTLVAPKPVGGTGFFKVWVSDRAIMADKTE